MWCNTYTSSKTYSRVSSTRNRFHEYTYSKHFPRVLVGFFFNDSIAIHAWYNTRNKLRSLLPNVLKCCCTTTALLKLFKKQTEGPSPTKKLKRIVQKLSALPTKINCSLKRKIRKLKFFTKNHDHAEVFLLK